MIKIQKITDALQHLDGLKAVIFDLDDTLYSEKEYVKSGYRAISRMLSTVEGADEKLWNAFEEKKSAIDELLFSEHIYSEELKQQCLRAYRFHEPDIHLYDGVEKMLVSLRQQGWKLGMITDGRPEGQRAKIKALKLDEFLDKIIVTDELGGMEYRKPNVAAFQIMQQHFGFDFSEMCYIGDNIKKDFAAPLQLGMKAIFFQNTDGLYYQPEK